MKRRYNGLTCWAETREGHKAVVGDYYTLQRIHKRLGKEKITKVFTTGIYPVGLTTSLLFPNKRKYTDYEIQNYLFVLDLCKMQISSCTKFG